MMKKIIKCLKANPNVTDWLINEVETESSEAYYVLQKLETTRKIITKEYMVTVYYQFEENNQNYLGSSTFNVSRAMNSKELNQKIDEAVFSAQFIKNKAYDIVSGYKKRSWKGKGFEIDAFELLDKIALQFFQVSTPEVKFNALEIIAQSLTNHIMNSKGVDLKKTLNSVFVEAIPSYDGEKEKVEVYKQYRYQSIDFDVIKKDALQALEDVRYRYHAQTIQHHPKFDVILQDKEVATLFRELIFDYSYTSVYKQNTDKKIGDSLQQNATGDLLTIGLTTSSKADAFDNDGLIYQPVTVIKDGTLVNYYGNNQYGYYLKMKPTGHPPKLVAEKGRKSFDKLIKKPHLRIIALSGIQIDTYSGYIGGEVRLGIYFDGKNSIPVSGFSFSGNLKKVLNTLELSKEQVNLTTYQGPKYCKLSDLEII